MNENLISNLIKEIKSLNIKGSDLWISEANCGFYQIKNFCEKLVEGQNILEIGSGSGILLSILSIKYKNLSFEGLEPFNDGFCSLKKLNNVTKKGRVKIHNLNYENFSTSKKYDLIFCINVIEHINGWKHFIDKAYELLKKDGKLIILCPNYNFPYESHFSIPIVMNKDITYKIFKDYILRFEKKNDYNGLWKSLNFIKKSDLIFYLNKLKQNKKITFIDDISIIDFMLSRVSKDLEFRNRKKIIGFIALILNKFGIFKFLKSFPIYLPYMKFIIKKI